MKNPTEVSHGGKPRAISYTRQSTAREDSITLESQDRLNREYARRHGYEVIKTVEDPGISGLELDKRPGIVESIEDIENDRADIILVWRWSRLSRKSLDQYLILDRIESSGGRVESSTESTGPDEDDELPRDVHLMMSKKFSSDISKTWRIAQRRRVEKQLPPGGTVPFGYQHVLDERGNPKKDMPAVPHPVHADVVRELYQRYLAGSGWSLLAKWMNDQGLTTTPRTRKLPNDERSAPEGRPWTTTTVGRLMSSGFAAGLIDVHDPECPARRRPRDGHVGRCPRRKQIRGAHVPLIDQATWENYQKEAARRRGMPPKSRAPMWWLGGSLVKCGRCGAPLIVNSYSSPKSQAICSAYKASRTCAGVWINRTRLEMLTGLWLGSRVEEWANKAKRVDADVKKQRAALERQIERAEAEEKKIRSGLARAAGMVALGDMDETSYAVAKAGAEDKLAAIMRDAEEARHRLAALDPDDKALARVAEWMTVTPHGATTRAEEEYDAELVPEVPLPMGGVEPQEWNSVVRQIIESIVVDTDTITITPWVGEPAVYQRALHAPKRPRRKAEQPHDARTGKFVSAKSPADDLPVGGGQR